MISLRETTSPQNVLDNLKHLRIGLLNIQGGGADEPSEWRTQYVRWTSDALELLGRSLRQAGLDQLVTSRRYWSLLGMDRSTDNELRRVIRTEVQERIAEFDLAVETLEQELKLWEQIPMSMVAVLDTNFLHSHHSHLPSYPWNQMLNIRPDRPVLLVVPIAVVDELDRQKMSNQKSADGSSPLRTRARAALKSLDDLLKVDTTVCLFEGTDLDGRSSLHLRLLTNDLDHVALDDADSEIIDRALTLQPFATDIRLVTYDSGMAFRARHAGLKAIKLSYAS